MDGNIAEMSIDEQLKIGPPPCDGCHKESVCRLALVACEDFTHYVDTGLVRTGNRVLSRRIYRHVFSN